MIKLVMGRRCRLQGVWGCFPTTLGRYLNTPIGTIGTSDGLYLRQTEGSFLLMRQPIAATMMLIRGLSMLKKQ